MLELLANLDLESDEHALLRFAFGLARQHGAYLTGLHVVTPDPTTMLLTPDAMLVLREREQAARRCDGWWRGLCREQGVDGAWEVHGGLHEAVLARRGSLADLVVTALSPETARMACGYHPMGRVMSTTTVPMLLVPNQWTGHSGVRKVAIAWNGSTAAARAVRAAAPLLHAAEEIIVLHGHARDRTPDDHGIPLGLDDWLRRRGLATRWRRLSEDEDDGASIHQRALDSGADLVVMGAWGHSRAGEWLLGGVTRHMLQHSHLPLLVLEA